MCTCIKDSTDHARNDHDEERQQLYVAGEQHPTLGVGQTLSRQRPLHHHLRGHNESDPTRTTGYHS